MLFIIVSHFGVVLNITGVLIIIIFSTPDYGQKKLGGFIKDETNLLKKFQKDRNFIILGIVLFLVGVIVEIIASCFFYDL